ncbi:hypothetical protein JCM10212_006043 [Sporobolomyces blumeae]
MSFSRTAADEVSTGPRSLYTIYARSEPFHLSRSQLEFDGPNFFTSAFDLTPRDAFVNAPLERRRVEDRPEPRSEGFIEAATRQLVTDRDPALFRLVVEYLSGYDVVPLHAGNVPPTMTIEQARRNLLRDADYFGLEGLADALQRQGVMPSYQDREFYDVVELPRSVSKLYKGEVLYPLDRIVEREDLDVDVRVTRPFQMQKNVSVNGQRPAFFVIHDVRLSDDMCNQFKIQCHVELDHAQTEKYRAVRSVSNPEAADGTQVGLDVADAGTTRVVWGDVLPSSDFRTRAALKVSDEFLDVLVLGQVLRSSRSPTQASPSRTVRHGSLEFAAGSIAYEPKPSGNQDLDRSHPRDGTFRTVVVGETVVLALDAAQQAHGIVTAVQPRLVYAETKTIDRWTRDHFAPAIDVSVRL